MRFTSASGRSERLHALAVERAALESMRLSSLPKGTRILQRELAALVATGQ